MGVSKPSQPSILDQDSLSVLYPILNDYSSLELSALVQNNSVAIPYQNIAAQATNGIRKV